MNDELKELLNRQFAGLEERIEQTIETDVSFAESAKILRSILGIGPVASTMLIAEMPVLGQVTGERARRSPRARSHRP